MPSKKMISRKLGCGPNSKTPRKYKLAQRKTQKLRGGWVPEELPKTYTEFAEKYLGQKNRTIKQKLFRKYKTTKERKEKTKTLIDNDLVSLELKLIDMDGEKLMNFCDDKINTNETLSKICKGTDMRRQNYINQYIDLPDKFKHLVDYRTINTTNVKHISNIEEILYELNQINNEISKSKQQTRESPKSVSPKSVSQKSVSPKSVSPTSITSVSSNNKYVIHVSDLIAKYDLMTLYPDIAHGIVLLGLNERKSNRDIISHIYKKSADYLNAINSMSNNETLNLHDNQQIYELKMFYSDLLVPVIIGLLHKKMNTIYESNPELAGNIAIICNILRENPNAVLNDKDFEYIKQLNSKYDSSDV